MAAQWGRRSGHGGVAGWVGRWRSREGGVAGYAHARCPGRSPSTPAPPRARSSAGSSAGRASSRRGCRARPGAYRVLRPPPRLVHRAGHAWEQTALPVRAAQLRARALLCPANVAPLAHPRNGDRDPRRGRAAPSRLVLARLRRLAAADAAGPGPSRAARRDRIRVLARRARRVARPGARARLGDRRRGRARVHPRRRRRAGARREHGLERALRSLRRVADRAQEPRRARPRRGAAGRRWNRGRRRRRPPAAVRARGRARRRCGSSARSPTRLLPGLYAGAEAFVLPSFYEGFGLCGARGDGVRRPGRRRRRRRAARDRRRRRAPGRRPRPAGSGPRSSTSSPTPPSASGCGPPASHAPARSPGTGPRSRSTPCWPRWRRRREGGSRGRGGTRRPSL